MRLPFSLSGNGPIFKTPKKGVDNMRKAIVFMILTAVCAALYAGDVANFVELGFSPDGKTFAFGQYGTDSKTLSPYGDLFFVDVAKNEFVPGANVSVSPAESGRQDPAALFESLKSRASLSMKRLSIGTGGTDGAVNSGRAVYAEEVSVPRSDGLSMHFRDFETGNRYSISLHQLVRGKNADVSSSFYITAKITDSEGNTVTKTVGHPDFRRAGVLGYRISRILTDGTNRALVFVVEKEMFNEDGSSVRYMVETLYL